MRGWAGLVLYTTSFPIISLNLCHLAQHILILKIRSGEGGWKVFQIVYEPKDEWNGCICSVIQLRLIEFYTSIDVLKTVVLQPFSISTFDNEMSFKTTLRFTCFLLAWHWTNRDNARFSTRHIRRDKVPWERDTARTIQGSLVLPSDPNDVVGKTIQRRLFTEWLMKTFQPCGNVWAGNIAYTT